jgi:hypothetical protein
MSDPVMPGNMNFPFVWGFLACEKTKQSRLAMAVPADKTNPFARVYFKGDTV